MYLFVDIPFSSLDAESLEDNVRLLITDHSIHIILSYNYDLISHICPVQKLTDTHLPSICSGPSHRGCVYCTIYRKARFGLCTLVLPFILFYSYYYYHSYLQLLILATRIKTRFGVYEQ